MVKLNEDLYGQDDTSYAQGVSSRILGVPEPTLDINGEHDPRAVSEGNHGSQGGGRSSQGEPANAHETEHPDKDGGT
jgi:hypothetical protein